MAASFAGTVLFGDVVDSRHDPDSTPWLRSLCAELEAAYPREARLASFAFTQGDELQGLLAPGADPFRAVLLAALHPDARELRWAVVAGEIDPGTGPAIERTGRAFLVARESIARARAHRDGLVAITGDPEADERLADLGPLLAALLADLTPRQREVARLIVIDELRRSEAADHLGRQPRHRLGHRGPGAGPSPRGARPDAGVDLRRGRPPGGRGPIDGRAATDDGNGDRRRAPTARAVPASRRERPVTDSVLVLTWLVFAHLVADFVLQNDWIAMNKATGGREGWRALARPRVPRRAVPRCPRSSRSAGPGSCTSSLVTGSHMVVDRWKVKATRHAEVVAQEQARARIARTGQVPAVRPRRGVDPVAGHPVPRRPGPPPDVRDRRLAGDPRGRVAAAGRSWTSSTRCSATGTGPPSTRVILTSLVIVSLLIVNTRGGVLLRARARLAARAQRRCPGRPSCPSPHPSRAGGAVRVHRARRAPSWRRSRRRRSTRGSRRPGRTPMPMRTDRAATPAPDGRRSAAAGATHVAVPSGAPARIGATIGALERLLIVAFMLTRRRGRRRVRHRGEDRSRASSSSTTGASPSTTCSGRSPASPWPSAVAGRARRCSARCPDRCSCALDEAARDPLVPVAREERLAVEPDVQRDADVERLDVRLDAPERPDVDLVALDRPAVDDVARRGSRGPDPGPTR